MNQQHILINVAGHLVGVGFNILSQLPSALFGTFFKKVETQ
jgi:hypothetical protein